MGEHKSPRTKAQERLRRMPRMLRNVVRSGQAEIIVKMLPLTRIFRTLGMVENDPVAIRAYDAIELLLRDAVGDIELTDEEFETAVGHSYTPEGWQ